MDAPSESNLQALWRLILAIPPGRCCSYGSLGKALPKPVSGFLVGRWIAGASPDLPWWRVVSKSGDLPLAKRDPRAAAEQRARLEQEGVSFIEGQIPMDRHGWEPPPWDASQGHV